MIYDQIMHQLKQHNISYREFGHDPILSYEDAAQEKEKCDWQGVESKNVFMKGNDEKYYLFVTIQGQKVDFKKLKEMLGVKLSIASEDDVKNIIECVPGCVAPFGFRENITIILDTTIFKNTDYLFSPGVTTKTIQANIQDLRVIFENLKNPIMNY